MQSESRVLIWFQLKYIGAAQLELAAARTMDHTNLQYHSSGRPEQETAGKCSTNEPSQRTRTRGERRRTQIGGGRATCQLSLPHRQVRLPQQTQSQCTASAVQRSSYKVEWSLERGRRDEAKRVRSDEPTDEEVWTTPASRTRRTHPSHAPSNPSSHSSPLSRTATAFTHVTPCPAWPAC